MAKDRDSRKDKDSSDLCPQSLQGLDDKTLAKFLLKNERGRRGEQSWWDDLKDRLFQLFTCRW